MKYLLAIIWCAVATQVHAAIYICQEPGQPHKVYQDSPCTTRTLGQLPHVPDAPLEDQQRVQRSIATANAQYIKRMQMFEKDRQAALEEQKLQLALAIERERLAQLEAQNLENSRAVYVWPQVWHRGYRGHPSLSHRGLNHRGLYPDRWNGTRHRPPAVGVSIEYNH